MLVVCCEHTSLVLVHHSAFELIYTVSDGVLHLVAMQCLAVWTNSNREEAAVQLAVSPI